MTRRRPAKRDIIVPLWIVIAAALISCGPSLWNKSDQPYKIASARYDISLLSVEKSVEIGKVLEKQKIQTVSEEGVNKFYFEDDLIAAKWHPAPNDIVLNIRNKTDHPVTIVWDESEFNDDQGITHRLLHSGIGYEKRNDVHPPTVIYSKDSLEDFVFPSDYWQKGDSVHESGHQEISRTRGSFLPVQIKGTEEDLRRIAEPLVGKTFQVILALHSNGVGRHYICTFIINGVNVTEREQQPKKSTDNMENGKRSRRGGF